MGAIGLKEGLQYGGGRQLWRSLTPLRPRPAALGAPGARPDAARAGEAQGGGGSGRGGSARPRGGELAGRHYLLSGSLAACRVAGAMPVLRHKPMAPTSTSQTLMKEVSEANEEQIARKRAEAERERDEEMRVAEYIRQRDAREQVRPPLTGVARAPVGSRHQRWRHALVTDRGAAAAGVEAGPPLKSARSTAIPRSLSSQAPGIAHKLVVTCVSNTRPSRWRRSARRRRRRWRSRG